MKFGIFLICFGVLVGGTNLAFAGNVTIPQLIIPLTLTLVLPLFFGIKRVIKYSKN